jgi:hypothetical protein
MLIHFHTSIILIQNVIDDKVEDFFLGIGGISVRRLRARDRVVHYAFDRVLWFKAKGGAFLRVVPLLYNSPSFLVLLFQCYLFIHNDLDRWETKYRLNFVAVPRPN